MRFNMNLVVGSNFTLHTVHWTHFPHIPTYCHINQLVWTWERWFFKCFITKVRIVYLCICSLFWIWTEYMLGSHLVMPVFPSPKFWSIFSPLPNLPAQHGLVTMDTFGCLVSHALPVSSLALKLSLLQPLKDTHFGRDRCRPHRSLRFNVHLPPNRMKWSCLDF